MTEPPRYERRERLPTWLKVAGVVILLVAVLVVVLLLVTGGGDDEDHGPRRHGLAGGPASQMGSTR
jgi:hypothetical protein